MTAGVSFCAEGMKVMQFQQGGKMRHYCRSDLNSRLRRTKWWYSCTCFASSIICHKKTWPWWTTMVACCSTPTRDSNSRFVQALHPARL